MKRVARLLGFLGLVCLLASCGKRSFITDTSYRQRVEQDFNQKKERLPQGDLFAIFDTDLTSYEREALEFLYAYMPLADIADYSGEFHLMNVRASKRLPMRCLGEKLFLRICFVILCFRCGSTMSIWTVHG